MFHRLIALTACLALLCGTTNGCVAALLDAGYKEANDHGDHARYENKDFGEHFLDSLLEPDDDDHHHHDCSEHTVVVIDHG